MFSNVGSRLIEIHNRIYGADLEENIEKQWEALSIVIVQSSCRHELYEVLSGYKICKKCNKVYKE